jgi:signal transduction histidine kinase
MPAKILIVDDDANMRESIHDNLEVDGYQVSQAESGAQALAAVAKGFYDVILMDYNLTDATGIEVIRQIRRLTAHSQILMLTAHASLDTALKAIQESVYDFLIKPVDFNYLKLAIAKALEKLRLEQENRRLITDLQKANEQLSNLNQMKSKFMSMASHDLANSLMTVQVSFEMLTQSLSPSVEQKRRMGSISHGMEQISRLIEDLVDWAAIEQGRLRLELELFAPGALVEEAIVAPQARACLRGIELSAQAQGQFPPVRADRRRLAQVLSNLLENAIRHTLKPGPITVAVSKIGSELQFAVKDSGEGIAPEEVGKIFRSFYQGQGQAGAGRLGLGLSIAKEIVEAHKGRLWVESLGRGLGATFYFTIPAEPSA